MATLRTSVGLYSVSAFCSKAATKNLLKCTFQVSTVQQRFLCRKEHLDPEVVAAKPKPWPYETKMYSFLHHAFFLDKTTTRWDENTKVIAVDGPIGVGKEKFAKQLAEICGMKYVPEPDIDALFYDERGFDFRCLNCLLPEQAQFYDLRMLHENPYHYLCGSLQFQFMRQRSFHYLNALAHLYNTGQGIVTVRSPWSDRVFMDALFKHGYVFKDTYNYYCRVRRNCLWEYQRPHLQIYLDINPELSMQRIKSKPNSMEAKSKVLNLEFLTTLDDIYKNNFLPEIYKSSELLVYDWTEEGDMDEVVEDLERLDFDQYALKGDRLEDWRTYPDYKFTQLRMKYTNEMHVFAEKFNMPKHHVEGMWISNDSAEIRRDVMHQYYPNYGVHPFYDHMRNSWWQMLWKTFPNYRERHAYEWKFINPIPCNYF